MKLLILFFATSFLVGCSPKVISVSGQLNNDWYKIELEKNERFKSVMHAEATNARVKLIYLENNALIELDIVHGLYTNRTDFINFYPTITVDLNEDSTVNKKIEYGEFARIAYYNVFPGDTATLNRIIESGKLYKID